MPVCRKCQLYLPDTSFRRRTDGNRPLSRSCNTCLSKYQFAYRINNLDKVRASKRRWNERNKDYNKSYRRSHKKIPKNTPQNRISRNLGTRLNALVRDRRKSDTILKLLGCSSTQFVRHLESLWLPNMSWNNYGRWKTDGVMTWHIDHIIPCAAFDLTKEEEQYKCFHWSNLRPLWALDNIRKGKRLDYDLTSYPNPCNIPVDLPSVVEGLERNQ